MHVIVEKKDRITTVIINRPEVRNAVNMNTARALADAFYAFDEDPDADVAILCGTEGYFCAGADLKEVASGSSDANKLSPTGDGPMGPSRMLLSKPVIAAITGHAVAGGMELALWCDMRVMETTAVMGIFCRRWGVPLIDGGTIRLPRLIGQSRALDLIMTGRPVEAEEALAMGLVNRVVSEGQARTAAEIPATQLRDFPQRCLRNDRRSVYEQWSLTMEQAIENEFQLGMDVINSHETVEGARAFAKGLGRHGKFE